MWEQIEAGQVADFNKAEERQTPLDPKKADKWSQHRTLRPEYLADILSRTLPHKGVNIFGARLEDTLDLSDMTLGFPIGLYHCRFEAPVFLNRLHAKSFFSLQGSKFAEELLMNRLRIDGDLFMRKGAEFARVDLGGAKIGGTLDMNGSRFSGELNMSGLDVDGGLYMRNEAGFMSVNLGGARIGGQLDMSGSFFMDKLHMNGLQAENGLFMRDGGKFAGVNLSHAKIGRQLDMDGSSFSKELFMESISVGGHVFMRGTELNDSNPVNLVSGEIGGSLVIACPSLPTLDLTGTRIEKELSVGSESFPVSWADNAKLILKNVKVGALNDHKGSWPADIDVRGFKYDQLGGFEGEEEASASMENRDVSWFIDWLEKQKEYSPQPYHQLAEVFTRQGHKDKAKEILYAGKERERKGANCWRWCWLGLQKVLIGYGHRLHYAAFCALVLIALGVIFLRLSGEGIANGMPFGLSYSFDMLLPIIELRKWHYTIDLQGFARYYFYFHQIMGYVLGLYLIAGLSGLIDREK